jgi:hypothetical protein
LNVYGDARITGLVTASNISVTNLNIGLATVTTLNIGITSITSGVITATSGVVTYYGDGSNLLNLPTSQWIDVDPGLGFTSIYAAGNVGIATSSPVFPLQVGNNPLVVSSGIGINSTGDIYTAGIVTALSFSGSGSNLASLNASNVTSGTLSTSFFPANITLSGIITASTFVGSGASLTNINANNITSGTLSTSRFPSDIAISGIITATTFVGNLTGTATTATTISSSGTISVTSVNSGFTSTGIATITEALYVVGFPAKVGVGTTTQPEADIEVNKTGISSIRVISGNNVATIGIGRSAEVRTGNTNTFYTYSTPSSLDVINSTTGNVNNYLNYGTPGFGTGSFYWIYGQNPSNPIMSLTYNGNLGIGITNPPSKLYVVGNSYITGVTTINSNLNVSGDITVDNITINGSIIGAGITGSLGITTLSRLGISTNSISGNSYEFFVGGDPVFGPGVAITATGIRASGNIQASNLTVTNASVTNINSTGIVTSLQFKIPGGTSSQFLKANGSIDSSTYITAGTGSIVNADVNINAAIGARKVSFIQPPSNSSGTAILGVARTLTSKLEEVVSVKDFGAVGNGVADDTLAIQKTFDWLAQRQVDTGIPGPYGHVHFPQGIYRLTSYVNVYGYVTITGTGTGYIMGSVLRQETADTDIFRFYSNFLDLGLGVNVEGLIFEHMDGDGSNTGTGVALKFPRIAAHYPPFNGQVMSSASHYIRDCRYGALYRFGKFAEFEGGGDILIQGCMIDVCRGAEAIKFGTLAEVGEVRLTDNCFYSANSSINIVRGSDIVIANNIFTQQEVQGGSAIKLRSSGTITPGDIKGIVIANNVFRTHYRCLEIDGSAINVLYANNSHTTCLDYPIVVEGNQPLRRLKFTNNRFNVANNFVDPAGEIPLTTYSRSHIINITSSTSLANTEILDNRIDANNVGVVTSFFNDAGSSSYLGSGMTLRNNIIERNGASITGSYLTYVPASADELVVNSQRTFSGLPSAQPMFYFEPGGLSPEESVTFDVDYEVRCLSSVNLGTRVGKVTAAMLRLNQAGPATTQGVITELVGIADDYNGSGGANLPIVQFTFTYSPNPSFNVTVTWPAYASTSTIVTCKAHSFRSTGSVIIKSAT